MNSITVLIIALAIIIVAIGITVAYLFRRRSMLRHRFGPEYERTVHETGSTMRAEQELDARARRVSKYRIHPLSPDDGARFTTAWRQFQAGFVDEPRKAVEEADALVDEVIKRLAEVFSDERNRLESEWERNDKVSTEDLRQALQRYRSFFERLLAV